MADETTIGDSGHNEDDGSTSAIETVPPADQAAMVDWLRGVARGLWFSAVAYALFGLLSMPQAQSTIGRVNSEVGVNVKGWLAFLSVVGCGVIGNWMVAKPEPGELRASRMALLRTLLRVAAVVECCAVLFRQGGNAIRHDVDPQFGLGPLAFSELNLSLGVTIMWCVLVCRLQRKIGQQNLVTVSQFVALGLVLSRVLRYWAPWAMLSFGALDATSDLCYGPVTLYAELVFALAAALVAAVTARAVSQLAADQTTATTGQNPDGGSTSQDTSSPVRG